MKTVIVKFERSSDWTLWGRCYFNGDLYIEAGIDKANILIKIAELISNDYPNKEFKIRAAKYNLNIKP